MELNDPSYIEALTIYIKAIVKEEVEKILEENTNGFAEQLKNFFYKA